MSPKTKKSSRPMHEFPVGEPSDRTGYTEASRPTAPVTAWATPHEQRILNRPPRMPGPSEFIQGRKKMPVPFAPARRGDGEY